VKRQGISSFAVVSHSPIFHRKNFLIPPFRGYVPQSAGNPVQLLANLDQHVAGVLGSLV